MLTRSMARVRIGTSGYTYSWNEGKPTPFQWYVDQGFNTVEINASFYRFPTLSWTKAWLRAPEGFDFSVKVNKALTHRSRLGDLAVRLWPKFVKPLQPLEERIAFWLFQMPPNFRATEANMEKLREFFKKVRLQPKAVVEFRHESWWGKIEQVESMELVFCSVDAPGLPRDIVATNDAVYLRLHGRTEWYAYTYSEDELRDIADRVKQLEASRKYIYLNNDHGMLPNGKLLMGLLGA